MKMKSKVAAALAMLALPTAGSVIAAGLPGAAAASISSTVQLLSAPIAALNTPQGVLGSLSLGAIPALNPKLPLLGSGLPFISTLTVGDGLAIVEGVSVLRQPLPGLGAIDAALGAVAAP